MGMKSCLLAALVLSAAVSARQAVSCGSEKLSLQVSAPSVTGTVTRLDLSWFGLEQDGSSPVFFTAHICNGNDAPARVRLIVGILVTPTDPKLAAECGAGGCWAEEEITKVLEIPANGTLALSSKDLYTSSYEPGGYDPANAPFRKLLSRLGRIPAADIKMFFGLTCEENKLNNRLRGKTWDELAEAVKYNHFAPQVIESQYRPFDGVSLLQPGGPEGFPEIWSTTPVFSFRSDIAGYENYGSDKRFQLNLWTLAKGEGQAQAVGRRPDQTLDLDAPLVAWPGNWPPLRAGESYVWRVLARDRGPVSGWLASEPYGFRVAPLGTAGVEGPAWINELEGLTPEQMRLLRLLARVMGPKVSVLEQAAREGKIDPASLKLDGKPLSVERLEAMVPDFESGKDNVIEVGMP